MNKLSADLIVKLAEKDIRCQDCGPYVFIMSKRSKELLTLATIDLSNPAPKSIKFVLNTRKSSLFNKYDDRDVHEARDVLSRFRRGVKVMKDAYFKVIDEDYIQRYKDREEFRKELRSIYDEIHEELGLDIVRYSTSTYRCGAVEAKSGDLKQYLTKGGEVRVKSVLNKLFLKKVEEHQLKEEPYLNIGWDLCEGRLGRWQHRIFMHEGILYGSIENARYDVKLNERMVEPMKASEFFKIIEDIQAAEDAAEKEGK